MKLMGLRENNDSFYSITFCDEELSNCDIRFTYIKDCQFRNCKFLDVVFDTVNFTNCTFVNCKFIKGIFSHSTFTKNVIEDCDFVETGFAFTDFTQNCWKKGLWKYVSLSKGEWNVEYFEEFKIVETEINDCKIFDGKFDISLFQKSSIRGGLLRDTNFSSSVLDETFLDIQAIENCFFTPSQGLDLLSFYGFIF